MLIAETTVCLINYRCLYQQSIILLHLSGHCKSLHVIINHHWVITSTQHLTSIPPIKYGWQIIVVVTDLHCCDGPCSPLTGGWCQGGLMLASGECTMESPLYVDSSAVCGHGDPSSKMSRPGSPQCAVSAVHTCQARATGEWKHTWGLHSEICMVKGKRKLMSFW